MRQVAIIGGGNMGGAIARGLINAGFLKPTQLFVCDKDRAKLEDLSASLPVEVTYLDSAVDAAEQCDVVLLAVKPIHLPATVEEMRPVLQGKAVISIAAGITTRKLSALLEGTGATWLRVMPNTPALLGEGMTALCQENTFSQADLDFAKGIFNAVGRTVVLPERLFDGVVAVSGSSPAYVYMLIEAMTDAAVREGIQRPAALQMAAQSVLGSALMVLSSGEHPAALRDAVCSPGGTTIEAVAVLEREGFRAAVMDAMDACARKSQKMAEQAG